MKRIFKRAGIVLLLAFIAIQFFRPAKNQSTAETPNAIEKRYEMPAPVSDLIKRACNDCHSYYISYPWYAEVQPVRWWLQHHVNEGKAELNFDEFASYSRKKKLHKLDELVEMVEKDEMPLSSYTWIHSEAKLNKEEKWLLMNWARNLQKKIETEP